MKFMKKPEKGISVWPILLLLAVLGLLAILARFSYTDYVRPASDKMLVEVNQTDHTDNADPFTKGALSGDRLLSRTVTFSLALTFT